MTAPLCTVTPLEARCEVCLDTGSKSRDVMGLEWDCHACNAANERVKLRYDLRSIRRANVEELIFRAYQMGKSAALIQADIGLPQGWRIVPKQTCYTLVEGNSVIASLAGPDAEENAAIIARTLSKAAQAAAPVVPVAAQPVVPVPYIFDDNSLRNKLEEYFAGDGVSTNEMISWVRMYAEKFTKTPVEQMLEINALAELGEEVARLQKSLVFWLPSVTDREDEVACRILEDAFLLVGIDGNLPDDFKSAQEMGWVSLAAAPQPAASVTDVAKDAARYQFLRKGFGDFGPDVDMHNAFVDGDEKMDAAIDAAIAAQQGEKTK